MKEAVKNTILGLFADKRTKWLAVLSLAIIGAGDQVGSLEGFELVGMAIEGVGAMLALGGVVYVRLKPAALPSPAPAEPPTEGPPQ